MMLTFTPQARLFRSQGQGTPYSRPRMLIGVPPASTPVERRAVKESAKRMKVGDVRLVEEPMAGAARTACGRIGGRRRGGQHSCGRARGALLNDDSDRRAAESSDRVVLDDVQTRNEIRRHVDADETACELRLFERQVVRFIDIDSQTHEIHCADLQNAGRR